ncbi:hypothetical protein VP01_162g3 [Puccinia sorghi]|uniref:Tet-like 2OG-Fe(II) oxygenase domain-containing protein n=1 Tax=Puccinia sorghi TaxID=27349 RepID=A0A0L6VHF7_9BASI|nr:hypothetical protein VP01_162g3 [Puccinia sorghi]
MLPSLPPPLTELPSPLPPACHSYPLPQTYLPLAQVTLLPSASKKLKKLILKFSPIYSIIEIIEFTPFTGSLILKRMTSISFKPSCTTPNGSSAQFPPVLKYGSSWVGEIIGDLFKTLAHEPFQKNHNLMKFYDLSYGELPELCTCSSHVTFTTNSFFNPPPHT